MTSREAGTTTPQEVPAHEAGATARRLSGAGALPVRTRVIGAAALAAAAAVGLVTALPAWADTTPALRDTHVLAATSADKGTGNCGVPQNSGQDVWVFTWPGGGAGSLEHLTVRYDTDGDEQADTSRTESDAANLSATRSLRYAITTPAGWLLVDGTSLITGTAAQNQFRLAAVCAGQASAQPTPVPGTSAPAPRAGGSPPVVTSGPPESGVPGASASTSPTAAGSSPPVSGSAPASVVVAGRPSAGLVAAGGSRDGGSTSDAALPPAPNTELASARRPVTPYVAAGLVLVAASSMLLGVRRRRARAWAGPPAGTGSREAVGAWARQPSGAWARQPSGAWARQPSGAWVQQAPPNERRRGGAHAARHRRS